MCERVFRFCDAPAGSPAHRILRWGLPPNRPCAESSVLRRSCFFWRAVPSFEHACIAKLAACVAKRLISEGGHNKPPNLLAQNGKICAWFRLDARPRPNAKKERRGPWKGPRLICDKPFAAAAVADGEVEAPAVLKPALTSRFAAEVFKQVATGNRASYRTLRGSAVKL